MCFLWSWILDYITWLLLLRLILHLYKWDLARHENEFCSKWQNDNWSTLKFDNLSHFQNVIRNDSPPSKRKRHYDALRTKIDMWLNPKTSGILRIASGIFNRTFYSEAIFKTQLYTYHHLSTLIQELFKLNRAYSKPYLILTYSEHWQIRNTAIFRTRNILRTLSYNLWNNSIPRPLIHSKSWYIED